MQPVPRTDGGRDTIVGVQPEHYTAVIFTNQRTGVDDDGYLAMAEHMDALAATQPGYLGIESVRGTDGTGITVSYWVDDDAARAWKLHAEHELAQSLGRSRWYDRYRLRVATVEREYVFVRPIFHLATPDDWEEARQSGRYVWSTRGITVADEGFVHCSCVDQMRGVANRFYADLDELVIVHLDRDALEDGLRFEPPADGIEELFPHLYHPIPLEAVTATTVWRRHGEEWGDPPLTI
jgi:uncharacterized protein (DUF952 family)/heme-degrading monooxygenase HmoA